MRSAGACGCDWAEATAGTSAARAARAPTRARTAVRGMELLGSRGRLRFPNAGTRRQVARTRDDVRACGSRGAEPRERSARRSGAGGEQLARDLQVLAEHRKVVAGEAADRPVAPLADLVLGLLDVLDVVLDLEVGIGTVERRAGERADRPQLPLLARRRRLGDVDTEAARRAVGVLQRLRVVLDEPRPEGLHGGGRALGLRGGAADDLEAIALDAGREPGGVLRGDRVTAGAAPALLQSRGMGRGREAEGQRGRRDGGAPDAERHGGLLTTN